MIRSCLIAASLLSALIPALAQTSGGQGPLGNLPHDWTREERNGRVYYPAPDGEALAVFYRGEFWAAADIVDQFAMGYEIIGCTRLEASESDAVTPVAFHEVRCPEGVGPARVVFLGVSASEDVELSVTLQPGDGESGEALVADMRSALRDVAENRISLPTRW